MSGPDIKELARESLPQSSFPVGSVAQYRFYLAPEVHRGIQEHAKHDTSVEICGVLVGTWEQDQNGPFAKVTEYIRGQQAASKFAEVTFTHESWAQINKEMDTKFSALRIIGWYHSHPDFGIFLSDRDVFIQQHFFSGAGQVAYVVDPVRDLEGIFVWMKGVPELINHYWVGDRICTIDASHRRPKPPGTLQPQGTPLPQHAPTSQEGSGATSVTTLLTWLAMFLLGYLLAGMRSQWEQNMLVQGAVAHYGTNKVMKLGLEQDLQAVRGALLATQDEFRKLPGAETSLTKEGLAAAEKLRKQVDYRLTVCGQALSDIEQHYGLTTEEQKTLAQLVTEKQRELRQQAAPVKEQAKTSGHETKSGTSSPAPESKPASTIPSREKPADAARPGSSTQVTQ